MNPGETPDSCPNCGSDVPSHARACPQCGSDEQTGWADDAAHDSAGLPDDEFDYDDFVKREFGGADPRPRGVSWFWWVVAIVTLITVALWLILGVGRVG
jgi:hypothetical protein